MLQCALFAQRKREPTYRLMQPRHPKTGSWLHHWKKFSLAVGALIYRTEASRISEENANPMLEYLPHHTIRLLSL